MTKIYFFIKICLRAEFCSKNQVREEVVRLKKQQDCQGIEVLQPFP